MCGVMIVSGESKTGQTHSRARSRRRVGESDASRPCEATVVSNHHHAGMIRGMTSTPIVVEDEDDDVVVSSPTAFAQVMLCFFDCFPNIPKFLLKCRSTSQLH